jgi:mono/diheme cytochrome c family protein
MIFCGFRLLLPVFFVAVLAAACRPGEPAPEASTVANEPHENARAVEEEGAEPPAEVERSITLRDVVPVARESDDLDVEADFGEILFERNCAVCHGERGRGKLGPALAGNSNLAHRDYVVARILLGGGGMPAFVHRLDAAELAGVATYISTTWGNDYGSLSPEAFELQWFGIRLEEPPKVPGETGPAGQLAMEADVAANEAAATRAPLAEWDFGQWGSELYANVGCGGCHSSNGAGGIGPALAENTELADDRFVIHRILNGGNGMPAYETMITDGQLAAIATHIRTSWGNDYSVVSIEEVAGQSGAATQVRSENGERLFDQVGCAGCHGSQGGGGVGPPLAGNIALSNQQYVLTQILFGGGGMPAFGDRLNDREVADVASYVRNAWGNDYGAVRVGNASSQRQAQQRRAAGATPTSAAGPAAVGSRLFTLRGCANCHGQNGEGYIGPPLAGNRNVGNAKLVVTQLLHGGGGMPAFGDELSRHQLAAVAGFVRTSWENDFGSITADQVDMYRRRPQRAQESNE